MRKNKKWFDGGTDITHASERVLATASLFDKGRLNQRAYDVFCQAINDACELALANEAERVRFVLQSQCPEGAGVPQWVANLAILDNVNLVELRDEFATDKAFIQWAKGNQKTDTKNHG